ncbi:MAG: hypothetical protein KJO31_05555 [Gammaproteobacteria bacterium]|nr:hypothetical protein [Gammaproteobacteria bacterium]
MNSTDLNNQSQTLPLFEFRDLAYLVLLPLLFGIAWLVPQRYWHSISNVLVTVLLVGPGLLGRLLVQQISAATAGTTLAANAKTIARSFVRNKIKVQLEYLRSLRPGGWRCELELQGEDVLQRALKRRSGVILWVTPSTSSDLVVKRCLHQYGWSIAQLSSYTHGYSSSRFGVRFINAMKRRVEDRYIARRMIIYPGNAREAVAEINERLSRNEVIVITAVKNEAGRSAKTTVLSALLPLGGGAIGFAHNTGCAVLPVFCFRDTDKSQCPRYRVVIRTALDIDSRQPKHQVFPDALRNFGTLVEQHAVAVPDQWNGWSNLITTSPVSGYRQRLWKWLHKPPLNEKKSV